MKRIYLYMTLLAAVLMTGCSNDDVIDPEIPVVGEEALFFSMGVNDGLVTKADVNAIGDEAVIKNLTVFLFNESTDLGAKDYSKRVEKKDGETLDFVGDVAVDPGTYSIILLANTAEDLTKKTGLTLATLNKFADDITTQSKDGLLMVSKLYTGVTLDYADDANTTTGIARNTYYYMFNAEKGEDQGLKYYIEKPADYNTVYAGDNKGREVVLTRLASRIQLESIELNFTENLDGASFRLDSVYLVNLRPSTLLWSDDDNYEVAPGASKDQYYRGAPEDFGVIYGMIYPGSAASVKGTSAVEYGGATYTKTDNGKFEFTSEGDMFQKYAFENRKGYVRNEENKTEYDTRLVICGAIKLATGQQFDKTYYHIPITGIVDDAVIQVERNNIYKINVKLTGYGENRPDGSVTTPTEDNPGGEVPETPNSNAKFDVKITVDPWKVINQYEEEPVPAP